ncbi:MAG: hypothetical protein WBI06_14170, partial [Paludibacter sp.]
SAEKLFYATEWLNLPAAGKLSEHLSIETQIVVQRKWSVIFKNFAFTPKHYYILLFIRLIILFQQTLLNICE